MLLDVDFLNSRTKDVLVNLVCAFVDQGHDFKKVSPTETNKKYCIEKGQIFCLLGFPRAINSRVGLSELS